jgi:hypothetical protein
MPGNPQNRIRLNSNAVIPVAVFGSATFDVRTIIVSSLRFDATDTLGQSPDAAPQGNRATYSDIDGDGYIDLVVNFRLRDTQINSSEEVTLIGNTNNGRTIHGTDRVTVI